MLKKPLLFLLFVITVYTRFVNLNWDRGYGLHPDENNLWGASRQVKLFSKLDPNFYAYGGLPIYLYSFFDNKVQARAVSAVSQTAIVLLLFYVGKKLSGWQGGIFSVIMGIFSAGLMQAAHFLTVESLIGFFGLLVVFLLLEVCETSRKVRTLPLAAAAIALGLGIGTKVSFAVFALPFLVVLRPGLSYNKAGPLKIVLQKTLPFIMFFLALSPAFFVFLLTNPYIIDRWESVRGTLTYESNVATGKLSVFYTRAFVDTIPGWFQIVRVFPFITGWGFVPLVALGLFVVCMKDSPSRTRRTVLLMTCLSALLSFFPLWAKWTRYTVQVLPILILIAGVGASWLWKRGKLGRFLVFASLATFLPPFFSTLRVYQHQDVRLAAADWAASHIESNAKIFTEGMDLGIIPLNPSHGSQITLFNFYELDDDTTGKKQGELKQLVDKSDYFISVSERVYGNSLRHPNLFPRSAAFYQSLFDGSLGYIKVYESSFCGFSCPSFFIPFGSEPLRVDDLHPSSFVSPEETFSVFDHPRVMIFAKRIMK